MLMELLYSYNFVLFHLTIYWIDFCDTWRVVLM